MGKKILLVVMILVFGFSFTESVKAGELKSDGDNLSVPVKYTVDNAAFTITVPTVIVADTQDVKFLVQASNINIRPDKKLEVFISEGCDDNGVIRLNRLGDSDNNYLETKVTIAGKSVADNNKRVALFKDLSGTTNIDGEVTLSGLDINENTKAGDYLATIVFKVEMNDEN